MNGNSERTLRIVVADSCLAFPGSQREAAAPSRRKPVIRSSRWSAGVLLLAASCATGPPVADPKAAAPFVGCYTLTLGPWEPKVDLAGDDPFIAMPAAIRLTDSIGRQGFERDQFLFGDLPGGSGKGRHTYWRLEGRSDIVLVWTDGFTSITAELSRGRGGLRGRAETH